jgi:hypothetical protein
MNVEKLSTVHMFLMWIGYQNIAILMHMCREGCIHEQNVCSFSAWHQNHFVLFVMHLAMRTLTRKCRIRKQYTDW